MNGDARAVPALAELESAIRESWSRITSLSPTMWTLANPSLGQCAVTSLVLQDYLGGELRRGMVGEVSHYWLSTPAGDTIDLTMDQFEDPTVEQVMARDREYVLANDSTAERYRILADAVRSRMFEYERCRSNDLPLHV